MRPAADSIAGRHFDVCIIGAGMSGLAAAIRLAMFGRDVVLLERHNAPGGLNSFYSLGGRKYDVGLHAVTNYVPAGTRGAPLTRLLRQLRIAHADLDLTPQCGSKIVFPFGELQFSNSIDVLAESVARVFPARADGFQRLVEAVRSYDDTRLEADGGSGRDFIAGYVGDADLTEMLLLPLLYYGSARENDMDVAQCVTLFKALYLEGFARPQEGVRRIIRLLLDRYRELGGLRRMKCGVRRIVLDGAGSAARTVELDDGTTLTADRVLSSAGQQETLRLCGLATESEAVHNAGRLSFVETLSVLDRKPTVYGWDDTIIFFNTEPRCVYSRPQELVDPRSGVICFPDNYCYSAPIGEEGMLRVTALANYDRWHELDPKAYCQAKASWFSDIQRCAGKVLGKPQSGAPKTIASDMFTPLTIERFTGHIGGAVYGAPSKWRDGRTPVNNVFICGTDQGFLGIIGALLSGISIANLHLLK